MTYTIRIQPHARARIVERCPGMKPARAVDEIRAALAAGRLSSERPSWLPPPFDDRHLISLYAWTLDEERVYVLHTTPDAFVCMSVLTEKRRELR